MHIIEWDPAYRQAWYDLCYAWLDQYDLIEEEDLRILRDPYDAILNHGGQILLAVEDGALLGTLSLIPEGEGVSCSGDVQAQGQRQSQNKGADTFFHENSSLFECSVYLIPQAGRRPSRAFTCASGITRSQPRVFKWRVTCASCSRHSIR